MTHRPAEFLDAILAAGADDTPRLVYADWLQEQGADDLAAFIRADCESARRAAADPGRAAVTARRDALLAAGGAGWLGPLGRLADRVLWERGLAVCTAGMGDFVSGHSVLAACPAVLGAEVTCHVSELPFLAADPWAGVSPLPRLVGLHVFDVPPGLEEIDGLCSSPLAPLLRSLKISCESEPDLDTVVRLLASLAGRGLGVRVENVDPWPAGVVRLLAHPDGPGDLDLSSDPRVGAGFRAEQALERLGRLPQLAGVRTLRLRNLGLTGYAVVEVLAASPYLSGVTHLDLGGLSTDPGRPAGTCNVFTDYLDTRQTDVPTAARAFCARLRRVVVGVDYD